MSIVDQSLVDALFLSGFEEPAEVHFESGAKSILCHFYDKFEVAKMFGKDIESSSPMIEVKTSDITGIKQNNKVVCRGIEYFVHEVQPDGEGFTNLILYYGND